MSLEEIWFVLFVVIIAGYLVLDGFDMGVGILHILVARDDAERRISLNSIGPIWDGNEVWLVLGGGVLFAAFPIVYAALFSGFYGAMVLVLLCLILRTVSIEFRSKGESQRWRTLWDFVFFGASAGLALLLGVALGNIIRGVPLDQAGQMDIGSILDLLNPFSLWLGATTIVMLSLHGALYLNLKTEDGLQERVRKRIPVLMGLFAVMAVATAFFISQENSEIPDVYEDDIWPLIFPAAAVIFFVMSGVMLRSGRDFLAFTCSAGVIAFLLFSIAAGLYPNLLVSSTDPDYNMTINNASSADKTLTVMLIIALIGMPFVLLYSAGVQYFFRGKVRITPHSY